MKLCVQDKMIVFNFQSSNLDLTIAHLRASLEQQSRHRHLLAAFIGLGKEQKKNRPKSPCLGTMIINFTQLRNEAQRLSLTRQHTQSVQRMVKDEVSGLDTFDAFSVKNIYITMNTICSVALRDHCPFGSLDQSQAKGKNQPLSNSLYGSAQSVPHQSHLRGRG